MRGAKPQPIRNKIDLADPTQIRAWTKRLGISADELQRMIAKVGNSIAAISKENELQNAPPDEVQVDPASLPAAEAVRAEVKRPRVPAS